jgi:uncharacterized protein (TIGR02147 family)
MNTDALYRDLLSNELANRCETNSAYSLRAFAKSLTVDPGALSRILSGKQSLSYKMAKDISTKLDLTPSQQKQFFKSVNKEQESRKLKRAQIPIDLEKSEYKGDDLSIDYFRVIADWYHTALMELTFVKGFKGEARFISRQLGISVTEAKLALERLVKLGLLEKKGKKFIKVKAKLSTTDRHLSTSALRKNQKQLLEKSIYSLENDPIENRNHTNMMMAIDAKKIKMAKKMIREFQMSLCNYLEAGKQDKVYNLSISLIPLSKGDV